MFDTRHDALDPQGLDQLLAAFCRIAREHEPDGAAGAGPDDAQPQTRHSVGRQDRRS